MTDLGLDRDRPHSLAELAAALTKAQAAFPQIPRDKTVTVQTRTGGSYTFKYAPLDTILAAVRAPLSENGLALSQLLDGDDLVTLLLHESGGHLEGRTPLPRNDGDTIQALGSAITYLRRYAIQALLGIAAEEDDDGNSASGNRVRKAGEAEPAKPPSVEKSEGGLIGIASLGKSGTPVDGQLRTTPDHLPTVGFVIGEGNEKVQVVATGPLAEPLLALIPSFMGARIQVYGPVSEETMRVGKYDKRFLRLALIQIKTPDFILPAPPADSYMRQVMDGNGVEPDTIPAFPDEPSAEEAAAIIEAEMAEAAR